MELIRKYTMTLAQSADGDPVTTTVVIILFSVFFTIFEATIEKLIFGEQFVHWLDPIFLAAFISYSAYAVWMCAVYNSTKG